MKDFTNKQLLEWCDKHHAEGKTLSIHWNGGSDDGWIHFEINGVECGEPEAEALVDKMYSELDYGSWAGEFSASGQADWNPEEKAFLGTDYYSETDSTDADADVEVRVPKYIPFDEIHISTQDEEVDTTTSIMIINGFIHPETQAVEEKLNQTLQLKFSEAIDKAVAENNQELESAWGIYRLLRSDFKEDGDELVAKIELVQYSFREVTEKDVEINLAELLDF